MQKKIVTNRKLFIMSISIASIIILIDQITKNFFLKKITNLIVDTNRTESIIKILDFLNIVLVWNNGISFGIFNGLKFTPYILLLINTFIAGTIIYFIIKSNDFVNSIALSFILGGALGNIIDRIFRGAVIDFIDFHFKQYHWPAFNIADSSIFFGIFLYFMYDLFYKIPLNNND